MRKAFASAAVRMIGGAVCFLFLYSIGFAAPESSDVPSGNIAGGGDAKPHIVMSVENYEFGEPARDFDYTRPVDLGNILSFVSGYLERASNAYLLEEKSNTTRAVVDRGAARILTERYPLTRFVMFGAQDLQKVIDLLRSAKLQEALRTVEENAMKATCYKLLHGGGGAGWGGGRGIPNFGNAGSGGIPKLECE